MEILGEYLQMLWGWLEPWVHSIPTWLIIILMLVFFIRLAGATMEWIIKTVIALFILSIILRFLGISLPTLSTIADTIFGWIHSVFG